MCNSHFLENSDAYEIMCGNIEIPDRPQMTVRRMPTACWERNALITHSGYEIFSYVYWTVHHLDC